MSTTRLRSRSPNGFILYEGPSSITGAPIVVIATGLKNKSQNSKTGAMIQTYILCADTHPVEAVKAGKDSAICGDCPHRGDGTGNGRTCYVTLLHGPSNVWKAYKRGSYPTIQPDDWNRFDRRDIRFGTYGDPAAAPIEIWQALSLRAARHTGYTHQWRTIPTAWSQLLMASADHAQDARDAVQKGYRYFRVRSEGPLMLQEVSCPASEEGGRRATCSTCGLCAGAGAAKNITILAHGNGGKYFALPLLS